MKAILEIKMPECCMVCELYYIKAKRFDINKKYMCAALNKEIGYCNKARERRYSGCPLKPVISMDAERGKYATYTTAI